MSNQETKQVLCEHHAGLETELRIACHVCLHRVNTYDKLVEGNESLKSKVLRLADAVEIALSLVPHSEEPANRMKLLQVLSAISLAKETK